MKKNEVVLLVAFFGPHVLLLNNIKVLPFFKNTVTIRMRRQQVNKLAFLNNMKDSMSCGM